MIVLTFIIISRSRWNVRALLLTEGCWFESS